MRGSRERESNNKLLFMKEREREREKNSRCIRQSHLIVDRTTCDRIYTRVPFTGRVDRQI